MNKITLNTSPIPGALTFRNASEFLNAFEEVIPTLCSEDALSLISSSVWTSPSTPPFVYAKLQIGARLTDFFVMIEKDTYEVIEAGYEQALRFILTAVFRPQNSADRRRLETYILVLTFFDMCGVAKNDVARELFLRGGIENITRSFKATEASE